MNKSLQAKSLLHEPLAIYALTFVGVVLAVLARWLLAPVLGNANYFFTFLMAVVYAAWIGGWKPAAMATFLGLFAAWYFIIPTSGPFPGTSTSQILGMIIYVTISALFTAFGEAMRNAKEQSRRQAELLRITLASIGDAVITTDAEGNVRFVNEVAEKLTGWPQNLAEGKPLEEVFYVIDSSTRQRVTNPGRVALARGTIFELSDQTILISRFGSERAIDESAAPIRSREGKIVGCVLVFRDVSKRKRDEQALKESQSRLESTLAAGEIGTWEFDLVQDSVRADRNLALMFGVTAEEANGGPLAAYLNAVHTDDREAVTKSIVSAIENGDGFESEYRLLTKTGEVKWVVARGRVDRDESGKPVRLPGVVMDITERRSFEMKLRESEERRRLALDAAELGSWNLDPNTNRLKTDERFQQIFSGQIGDISYEQAFSLIHPSDRERIRDAVRAAIQIHNPAAYAEEFRVVHPQGNIVRWVFGKGRAHFEGEGEQRRVVSFDGTVADITERKQMEDVLRDLAADLSEADRRKDEFLATLAHELRNPLAPIRNGLEIMRLSSGEKEAMEHSRRLIERQLVQLVRLVDDLLDVSRITQGKLELRTEHLDLSEAINSAVETSRGLIDDMGHELSISMPERPIIVEADLTRLSQVFMNLLNNAAKYSEAGGHIWLKVEQDGTEVAVSVRDAGIGIAADQLHKIFKLFSQIEHTLEKAQGGLGIGLSLVKRLVEMHGGLVEVKSEGIGQGAEFVVRLPVIAEEITQIEKPQEPVSTQMPTKILVVDDNRDGADSLAMMLKITGHDVSTAYDGEEALEVANQIRPDVILLDIGLPKFSGHEVCRRIRENHWGKSVLIIAQTGWGQEEDRLKSANSGFDLHLVKPIDPNSIVKLLAERHSFPAT